MKVPFSSRKKKKNSRGTQYNVNQSTNQRCSTRSSDGKRAPGSWRKRLSDKSSLCVVGPSSVSCWGDLPSLGIFRGGIRLSNGAIFLTLPPKKTGFIKGGPSQEKIGGGLKKGEQLVEVAVGDSFFLTCPYSEKGSSEGFRRNVSFFCHNLG